MSSGLYAHHKECAHATPGIGMTPQHMLCSACHKAAILKGGGSINGRWYCATCKPVQIPKERSVTIPTRMNKWTTAVHTHCMGTGQPITPQEAVHYFGNPHRYSANAMLNASARGGWFRREDVAVEGSLHCVLRPRYYAIEKAPVKPTIAPTKSYFTGLVRCRSIFELGDAL